MATKICRGTVTLTSLSKEMSICRSVVRLTNEGKFKVIGIQNILLPVWFLSAS